ncbi:hypothetical protein R1sor_020809 [Riccia sorocarpa]|uniref:Uncharacterized protein n=1 Tax=Riccia sorocarpa TaxID=122646 RepID=A0ABD3GF98_9MARC
MYDLWREFGFFANVNDRKYLEHLDFFIEAKSGRFFRPKEGQRRPILLSSLHGLNEELDVVKTYIFWKRRALHVKKLTPKAIMMAPKSAKEREKIPVKSPTQTPSHNPTKTTPTAPSSSSTPAKVGVCKSLALPTVALKEFRSQLEELGMRFLFWHWDFSADTLVKEFATAKKVLAEALMALFCPARMMYLVMHKVAFIERVVRKENVNCDAVFAQHVLHFLKTLRLVV